MKQEYLIIGSNNFWYASGITSLEAVKEEVKRIKGNQAYANPENGKIAELPDTLYVYKAEEIKRIELC